MKNYRKPRKRRKRFITVDLPSYFHTPSWDELKNKEPLVFILVQEGEVKDVLVKSVDLKKPPETHEDAPQEPMPKKRPRPEPAEESAPGPNTGESDPFDDELPEPDESEQENSTPGSPSEEPDPEPQSNEAELQVGARVKGEYEDGREFIATVLGFEPDPENPTEVLLKTDHDGVRKYVPVSWLRSILPSA